MKKYGKEAMNNLALELTGYNPRSEIPLYYLAWHKYLGGDVAAAKEYLRKIQDNSYRAKVTLERLEALSHEDAKEAIFFDMVSVISSVTFSFSIEK